jgi:outer membrane protein OmpA-like peptidoglycan-associated protein
MSLKLAALSRSVEPSLGLDTSRFHDTLSTALNALATVEMRAQAVLSLDDEEFSNSLKEIEERLERLSTKNVTLTLNDADFETTLKKLRADLDAIDDHSIRVVVDLSDGLTAHAFGSCRIIGQYWFDSNETTVKETAFDGQSGWRGRTARQVDQAVREAWIRDNQVYVLGSADPQGNVIYNERLAEQRARAVVAYLPAANTTDDTAKAIAVSAGASRWMAGFPLPAAYADPAYRSAEVYECDAEAASNITASLQEIFR